MILPWDDPSKDWEGGCDPLAPRAVDGTHKLHPFNEIDGTSESADIYIFRGLPLTNEPLN